MSWLDNAKSFIDTSGLTNPSKLYTPFTLFCTFFALYFNADILGAIFLSDNWEIQKQALESIKSKDLSTWFFFMLKTIGYAMLILIIYGFAQAFSAGFWALFNTLNIWLSHLANRSKYISLESYKILEKAHSNVCEREKDLEKKISEYHNWSPADFQKLKTDLESTSTELKETYEKLETSESDKDILRFEIDSITSINKKNTEEIAELHSANISFIDKIQILERTLDSEEKLNTSATKEILDLKLQLKESIKKLESEYSKNSSLTKQIKNIDMKNSELNDQNKNLSTELNRLRVKQFIDPITQILEKNKTNN